jgi:hypothetical protein
MLRQWMTKAACLSHWRSPWRSPFSWSWSCCEAIEEGGMTRDAKIALGMIAVFIVALALIAYATFAPWMDL